MKKTSLESFEIPLDERKEYGKLLPRPKRAKGKGVAVKIDKKPLLIKPNYVLTTTYKDANIHSGKVKKNIKTKKSVDLAKVSTSELAKELFGRFIIRLTSFFNIRKRT